MMAMPDSQWYARNLNLINNVENITICFQNMNLMNLSRVLNPPKTGFHLSAGLNLEKLNTILSETNRGTHSLNSVSVLLLIYV